MADNYLEKKMEDLRAGRAARYRGGVSGGERVVVLGYGEAMDALAEVVTGLRKEGKRVAFAGMRAREGSALAYSCGAQYHPVEWVSDIEGLENSFRLIWRSWRGVDRVVIAGAGHDVKIGDEVCNPDALQERVMYAVERVRRSQPVVYETTIIYERVTVGRLQ